MNGSYYTGYHVYSIEAEYTGAIYRPTGPGDCTPNAREPGVRYFAIGSEIPASSFVSITMQ
jgi:hypothetical protein